MVRAHMQSKDGKTLFSSLLTMGEEPVLSRMKEPRGEGLPMFRGRWQRYGFLPSPRGRGVGGEVLILDIFAN
jgi:hypothetical protein